MHGPVLAASFSRPGAGRDHKLVVVLDFPQPAHYSAGKISAMTAPLTLSPEPVR